MAAIISSKDYLRENRKFRPYQYSKPKKKDLDWCPRCHGEGSGSAMGQSGLLGETPRIKGSTRTRRNRLRTKKTYHRIMNRCLYCNYQINIQMKNDPNLQANFVKASKLLNHNKVIREE
jgi:hypothetical protein